MPLVDLQVHLHRHLLKPSARYGIIEPHAVSKLLQKIVEKEKPDLVFMGKQAIDDDCNCLLYTSDAADE